MIIVSETYILLAALVLIIASALLCMKEVIEDAKQEIATRRYWRDRADASRRHVRRLRKRIDYRIGA